MMTVSFKLPFSPIPTKKVEYSFGIFVVHLERGIGGGEAVWIVGAVGAKFF
jgi:hypothetical protein